MKLRNSLLSALFLASAAGVGSALTPNPASCETRSDAASIPCGRQIVYYSDATYTQAVGAIGNTPEECGCENFTWGVMSEYPRGEDVICIP